MNRYVITGLAVVVLAGVIGLVLSLRSDKSQAKPNGKAPANSTAVDVRPHDEPEIRVADRNEKPSVDIGDSDVVVSDDKVYYRDDGAMVRDHRGGDRPPLDQGATARPRGLRKVDPETVVAVRNAIRPHVNSCAKSLSDGAFGDKPMVQGEVKLSIKDNQLSVDEMKVQLRDIDDDSSTALLDCIRSGIAGMTLDATGHPDVDSYFLTLPYDIRR